MKKILILLSILAVLLVAGGCANTANNTDATNNTDTINKEDEISTKVQFFRNATMKIEYAGKTFLTDPFFAAKGTYPGFLYTDKLVNPMVDLPATTDEIMKDVEFILVSHTHIPAGEDVPAGPSDHFDAVAIEEIDKSFPIYLQPFDAAGIERVGFTNVTAVENSIEIEGIKVTRITGKHTDVDALLPAVGESSGYVLEAEGSPKILWTGDTILTDEIKTAITEHNPDIIITHAGEAQLPIDADGNVAKLIMGPEETIQIAELAPKAKIIAIHMEALDHCPITREELREKANAAGISEDRLMIPNDGETLSF